MPNNIAGWVVPCSLSKFSAWFSQWHLGLGIIENEETNTIEKRVYGDVIPTERCCFFFKPSRPRERDRHHYWGLYRMDLKTSGTFHLVVLCGVMYDAARHARLIGCHTCRTLVGCTHEGVQTFPAGRNDCKYKQLFDDFARASNAVPAQPYACHEDFFGSGKNVIQTLLKNTIKNLQGCVPRRIKENLEHEYLLQGGALRFIFRAENSYYWWETITAGLIQAVDQLHTDPQYARHVNTMYDSNVLLDYGMQLATNPSLTMSTYLDDLRK